MNEAALNSIDIHSLVEHVIKLPGNNCCVDCGAANPIWASLGFGVLICLSCAGFHRSLGAHITTVRSLNLDSWNETLLEWLELGGNNKFIEYLSTLQNFESLLDQPTRYSSCTVLYYSELLKSRIESRDPQAYNEDHWVSIAHSVTNTSTNTIQSQSPKSTKSGNGSKSPTPWMSDDSNKFCLLCAAEFTLFKRRHHCRRCGKVVCDKCAPSGNTRPILEWGMKEPVRHCRACYKSPSVTWDQ